MDATEHAEVTHGFLFADLRGYTQLVDMRGAAEASRLLERYRALTREVVAGNGGAEIKTEGDSFYVVLPSASAAVRCALALVAACASPPDDGAPIPVGVGIHAGESLAHEGGFVGSAVNIAARICAVAAAGELLASGTVRDLTRSITSARFTSVGRRSLKGLAEPIELFRVVPEGRTTPVARRRVVGRVRVVPSVGGWLALAIASIGIVGLAGAIVAVQGQAHASPSMSGAPGPASTGSIQPSVSGQLLRLPARSLGSSFEVPVPPGTYAPNANQDVASVTISEQGWQLGDDTADVLNFFDSSGTSAVSVGRIQVVFSGPCTGAETKVIGDRPQDLIDWLRSTPQVSASEPRAVNDLGLTGIAVTATIGPAPIGGCPGRDPQDISLWQLAGRSWQLPAGFQMRIEALHDATGTLSVILISPSAAQLGAFVNGPGRKFLDSIVLR